MSEEEGGKTYIALLLKDGAGMTSRTLPSTMVFKTGDTSEPESQRCCESQPDPHRGGGKVWSHAGDGCLWERECCSMDGEARGSMT